MKNKDEVFSEFKKFKALIENHTEKKNNTFQSDNGREFTSNGHIVPSIGRALQGVASVWDEV